MRHILYVVKLKPNNCTPITPGSDLQPTRDTRKCLYKNNNQTKKKPRAVRISTKRSENVHCNVYNKIKINEPLKRFPRTLAILAGAPENV